MIKLRVFGKDHMDIVDIRFNMATLYEMRKEMDTARELFLESQNIFSKVYQAKVYQAQA